MDKLEGLVRAVQAKFPDDPSAPSVVLAWIPGKEVYYVSVLRYREAFGQGRQVVVKDSGVKLEELVDRMVEVFK